MIGAVAATAAVRAGGSGVRMSDDGDSIFSGTDRHLAIAKQQQFLETLVCLYVILT
jgi:hypothetical protein